MDATCPQPLLPAAAPEETQAVPIPSLEKGVVFTPGSFLPAPAPQALAGPQAARTAHLAFLRDNPGPSLPREQATTAQAGLQVSVPSPGAAGSAWAQPLGLAAPWQLDLPSSCCGQVGAAPEVSSADLERVHGQSLGIEGPVQGPSGHSPRAPLPSLLRAFSGRPSHAHTHIHAAARAPAGLPWAACISQVPPGTAGRPASALPVLLQTLTPSREETCSTSGSPAAGSMAEVCLD